MALMEVRRSLAGAAALVLLCAGTAHGRAGTGRADKSSGPPSFLLVTIDTWRWDHIGVSGARMVDTPNLDGLARRGVYEAEAVTPCPLTTPAHASLLTGLSPLKHGVLDCSGYALAADVHTLAEAFRERGYHTAAFVSGDTLKRRYGLDRGFLRYDDCGMRNRGEADWLSATREGGETTRAVLEHLAGVSQKDPVFLWVHYFDAHLPYRRHPGIDERYPGRPYAAQVAYVDGQVGKLLSAIRADGRNWRLIVVGDHGEGLGDHGEAGHGYGLYRSTLHVPIILWPPPEKPLRHPRPWSLLDVGDTVREWFGLAKAAASDGESLFTEGHGERSIPAMTLLPSFFFAAEPCLGARRGRFFYIRHGREELYDLESDPDERRDLARAPASADRMRDLRQASLSLFPAAELRRAFSLQRRAVAPEDLSALQSLGYLSGATVSSVDLQATDVREVMRDNDELESAREKSFISGDPKPLLECYGLLAAKYPKAAHIWRQLGVLQLGRRDFAAASRAFEQAVRLDPADVESLVNLGSLTLQLGDAAKARELLEAALRLREPDPVAHKNLAIAYGSALNQPDAAIRHFERYLELAPQALDAPAVRKQIEQLQSRLPLRH